MLAALAQNWWVVLLRGIAAIVFGILAFGWPGITLLALMLLFGVYAVMDGVAAIAFGFSGRAEHGTIWPLVAIGALGVLAGLIAILMPGLTAVALLLVIAAWAIVRGVFEILTAIELRKHIDNEWMMGLSGALSILFGVLLVIQPGAGALALVWLIGAFAIAFGVVAVALALRLRGLKHALDAR
jgi:uncharacterized membrane protein HdeD (DUF308 family)